MAGEVNLLDAAFGAGLLASLALLPALAYLGFVWWMDRYDREPLSLVAVAFVWGATGAVVFGIIGTLALQVPMQRVLGDQAGEVFGTVVGAPLTEEVAKALIVLALAFSRHFDGVVDGMVYGVASALGFAAVENFFYFLGGVRAGPEALLALVVMRTAYTMVGHGVATSFTGAAIGAAKFSRRPWPVRALVVLAGLGLAILLHALGNGMMVLSAGAGVPALAGLTVLACVGALVVAVVLMQAELLRESAVLARELEAEVAAGRLSPEQVDLVASYGARLGHGLLKLVTLRWGSLLHMNRFLRSATSLGLRLHQARESPALGEDVESLREQVRAHLARGPVP